MVSAVYSICGWWDLVKRSSQGMYVPDMWSVVYVPHMSDGIYHSCRTGHIGHVVSVVSFTCDGWI